MVHRVNGTMDYNALYAELRPGDPKRHLTKHLSGKMSGIQIVEQRNARTSLRESFFIIAGEELNAAAHLIDLLSAGVEISLMNDLDEGGEGCTVIRKVDAGFETMNGGHGWQGDWAPTSAEELKQLIVKLAPLNLGGHWSTQGSITRRIGG